MYLAAQQVADRYNIGRSTVFELAQRGEIPRPHRFGRVSRWLLSELEAADAQRGAQGPASALAS